MAKKKQTAGNNGRTADGRFGKGNAHAFKPGQSGNPKGRPLDTITPHLREIVQQSCPGKDQRTYGRMIAEALIAESLAGNIVAIREVLDRLEGKPRQAIDFTDQSSDWRALIERHGVDPLQLAKEAQELADEILASSTGNDQVN